MKARCNIRIALQTKSSGRLTHGKSSTSEYTIWNDMKRRCYDLRSRAWAGYGGRGITVCDRWRSSFEAFLADMGERPSPQHSLDRIDNDGPYAPENCRWSTRKEQANNRRSNRVICAFGRTQTLAQWSAETGIKHNVIATRIARGMDPEVALLK